MGGPTFALQALSRCVLGHATRAHAAGLKCVPLEPAGAVPFILRLGFPTAKGTTDFRPRDASIGFILFSCAGLTRKDIGPWFHHNRLFAGKWFRHS